MFHPYCVFDNCVLYQEPDGVLSFYKRYKKEL